MTSIGNLLSHAFIFLMFAASLYGLACCIRPTPEDE